jgi:hypothetical protein
LHQEGTDGFELLLHEKVWPATHTVDEVLHKSTRFRCRFFVSTNPFDSHLQRVSCHVAYRATFQDADDAV